LSEPPDVASGEATTATLVASYEALRRLALGQRGPDDGPSLGLAILLRQGVAAWLHAWARCPRPADPMAPSAPPLGIPSFIHTELAQLWTQMAALTPGGRMDLTGDRSQKITPRHLRRQAYLYVRQSTLRQVVENTESTQRQYALRQRAVELGWPIEQVVVIDRDLGQSGASAADREGFQQLVRDVGLGRAGLVMGLEVSRLARNSMDWHRLLEICALTETLILDEDGLYDPAHFNDRLLLGLKGTMSEAELHVLRARLRGGIVNKARRGELEIPLPVGFVYDAAGRVGLDPDRQVQETLRAFFQTFRRTGSATATVKAFRTQQLSFPRRARYGPHQGETLWGRLEHSRALWVLHNPRYAGAFFFGRCQVVRGIGEDSSVEPSPAWTDAWSRLHAARANALASETTSHSRQRRRITVR
jgi:DNA invertase Pin-like site-specific DNA recombinase